MQTSILVNIELIQNNKQIRNFNNKKVSRMGMKSKRDSLKLILSILCLDFIL